MPRPRERVAALSGCSRRLPGATQRDYPPTQAAKTNVVGEGDASSRSREPLVDQVFRSRVRRPAKIVALESVRDKAAPLQAPGTATRREAVQAESCVANPFEDEDDDEHEDDTDWRTPNAKRRTVNGELRA